MKGFQELKSFRGDSSFKTWLTRIVINTATDALRRDARRSLGELVVGEQDFGTTDPDSSEDVRRAVSALPDAQRIPLVLRYWVDLSPREIADVLAVPLGTVHFRLARALRTLRTALEVPDAR